MYIFHYFTFLIYDIGFIEREREKKGEREREKGRERIDPFNVYFLFSMIDCPPATADLLIVGLGVSGAFVLVGIVLLLIWKRLTMMHDSMECKRFESEISNPLWEKVRLLQMLPIRYALLFDCHVTIVLWGVDPGKNMFLVPLTFYKRRLNVAILRMRPCKSMPRI